MSDYMASRIIESAYNYSYVVTKLPNLKTGIDTYLTLKGKEELIVE
ncbi:hypothetical protein JOC70_000361 [Clostridium pascui]|nr:hypothetical protein [Clostridium pascui]MBM7868892.1 hypothetical protein [Clostridium pascui]